MSPRTRRSVLRLAAATCLGATAGCLDVIRGGDARQATPTATAPPTTTEPSSDTHSSSGNPTATDCSAYSPPYPTDAPIDPMEYPERPEQLTEETIASFLEAYERAYQYNNRLANHPEHFAWYNEMDVQVDDDIAVEEDDGAFTATVSGQVNVRSNSANSMFETPTPTPLPSSHDPFNVSYRITDRGVRRDGILRQCW